jgi:DNA-binding response OmpR family regulator
LKQEPVNQSRILIVEDEAEICFLLRSRLTKEGHHVMVAMDGTAGLRIAFDEKPDLIILDLGLPHLSGKEVCKAIKESDDPSVSEIPIIMLTARNAEVDQVIGKVIGAEIYLTKPYEKDELLRAINKALSQRKRGDKKIHHLLLLEDDEQDALLFKLMISKQEHVRYDVIHAKTLREALRLASDDAIDLIVTDLVLPDCAGIDTIKELLKVVKGTPILVYTGYDDHQFHKSAIELGAQNVLLKQEASSHHLTQSIQHALNRRAA